MRKLEKVAGKLRENRGFLKCITFCARKRRCQRTVAVFVCLYHAREKERNEESGERKGGAVLAFAGRRG